MGFGKYLDATSPLSWGTKGFNSLTGSNVPTMGGLLDDAVGSMDRGKRAEELYGGVGNTSLPFFGQQYKGYDLAAQQRLNLANQAAGRNAYVSNQRPMQAGLGRMLAAEAQGNGVGQRLVRMQAQQAADQASRQQFAALGGARPGMQAMAARNAMLGSALAQSAVGQQAAQGSAQMTLGAQQQYGQHLQGMRGQDEAGQFQQRQLNDQMQTNMLGQQLGAMGARGDLSQMQQQGAIERERLRAQRYAALTGVPTSGEITGGLFQGLGGALFGGGGK